MSIRITDLHINYGLVSESGSPNVMRYPHHHDDIELNYLESGAMTYLLGGHQFSIEAGRLLAFWAAVPHQVTWIAPDTRLHWLYIPLSLVLEWDLPPAFVEQALAGTPLIDQPEAESRHDLNRFRQWHSDLSRGQPEIGKVVLLEVEARLRRLALASPPPPAAGSHHPAEVTGSGLRQARQMALFIARHHTEPLTIGQIARAVNLHPNYAMKIFRDQLNTSILEHLTRHRVAHAQRLLLTTDLRVLDIALEAGFGSLSRFYVAFRRFCGQSPGQYRRALRPGP
ncbi:MAG TPA: helix-turn-helix domain-containing protein [Spirillospora sp.]|nr:helix-turn-helix domain-containing protein [Spirillospora sp.]